MFCSQCGTQASDDARFCAKCGAALVAPMPADVTEPQAKADDGSLPLFGVPSTRWWGAFEGVEAFPPRYEWLGQRNTLLVCADHLVLLQGDEKRSAALDVIQAMGLVGGVIGALRGAKDVLANKKFSLTAEQAERLYRDKLLVWCKKQDAEIWRYNEKPWMFIKSSSEQLYCPFNSQAETLHAWFVLWCTAAYRGNAKPDISSLGCKTVVAGENLPEKQVSNAMKASRQKHRACQGG